MTTPNADAHASSSFVTTRWTQVLSARGESPQSQAALGELCAAYWTPIFRFMRRSGYDEETARDYTQEFVAQFMARNGLEGVEPSKGRFRSYLLGAVKHFLCDQTDRATAAKRGGGRVPISLADENETSHSLEVADPASGVPDTFFDRQWALTIIDRALGDLARESMSDGKGEQFEVLKPWLMADGRFQGQREAGQGLGLSEGATKVAIHRLRKRFRGLVKAEIGQTVSSPDEVQEELRYLVEVLSQG